MMTVIYLINHSTSKLFNEACTKVWVFDTSADKCIILRNSLFDILRFYGSLFNPDR
jgi:hypothetical protein